MLMFNNLFVLLLSIIVYGIYFILYRYTKHNFINWEANMLANRTKIPFNLSKQIVDGKLSIEIIEQETWKIAIENGCDFETACRIRDGKISLKEYIRKKRSISNNPFNFKEMQEPIKDIHIYEITNESIANVNSSNVNSWIYKIDQNISHFLLAGHANSAVCKQISSLIYNTYVADLEKAEDSLLVPGACYLHGNNHASDLNIKFPLPLPFSDFYQKVEPINELASNLYPFQEETGLTSLSSIENKKYSYIQKKIYHSICNVQNRKLHHIFCQIESNTDRPFSFFLPFYSLHEQPFPVVLELPLLIFESEDFVYLRKIHYQSLVLEMTDDALRRKGIYQDWLRRDEEASIRYERIYHALSNEEKIAKNGITIKGTRDYLNAIVTESSENGKETYTSPQEYYEKILPSLLKEDQKWIDIMDDLMSNIKNSKDTERNKRINEINIAVLIDSFIRGWPPIFLGGSREDESQKRYKNWCQEKRKDVWKVIYKQLESMEIRIEPFLEENTIFKVQLINDSVFRITPLYLTTNKDFLAFLSSQYGVTYYINKWSRRELKEKKLGSKNNNLKYAKKYYQLGAKWLDKLNIDESISDEDIIIEGVKAFKRAIECHPIVIQDIWNGWWRRFGRNTSQQFNNFKDLMRGYQAFDRDDHKTSCVFLKKFIKNYPNYIPDPYILLSIQNIYEQIGHTNILLQHKTNIKRHNELIDNINSKNDFIDSNHYLIEKYKSNKYINSDEREKLSNIESVYKERETLNKEFTILKSKIERMEKVIKDKDKEIWKIIKTKPDMYIEKAKQIAPEYVKKILEQEKITPSEFYILRYRPLHEILQGDEYIKKANQLYDSSIKFGEKKITITNLKERIKDYLDVEYLKKEDIEMLNNFLIELDKFSSKDDDITVIVREMVLRKEMDQIAQAFFKNGRIKYEQSCYLLPEFNEPIQQLIGLYVTYSNKYKIALKKMFNNEVPLRNFSHKGKLIPIINSNSELKLNEVWFDKTRSIIIGKCKNNKEVDLIKVKNFNNEEYNHLEQEINSQQFWYKQRIGMNLIEAILNIRIKPSPKSQRWTKVLQEMEDWLILLIAHLGMIPVPRDKETIPHDLIERFEGLPMVYDIDLNINRIMSEFLKKTEIQKKDVRVMKIKI